MNFLKIIYKELDSRLNFNYLKFRLFNENRQIQESIDYKLFSLSDKISKNITEPVFSIIIPLYGIDLVYVEECIKSITSQTYNDWEVCFCSDADPVKEVTEFVENLVINSPKKFKLISHKKNQGISKATLSALTLATGDFIVFIDADDTIHKRALELCSLEILSSEIVDFIYTNHDLMTDWGLRIKPFTKPIISPELLLNSNYINHLVVVRHDLVKKIPELFAEYTNGCQDWDFCLKAMHFSRKVIHIPFFLYHWRTRKGSIAESPFAKPWATMAQIEVRARYAVLASPHIQFLKDTNKWALIEPQKYESVENIYNNKSIEEWIKYFIVVLKNSSEKFIHLGGLKMPSEIESQICYAILPKVAFVWPFSQNGIRISYTTMNKEATMLMPLESFRSTFSMMTGNVLTGPFDHAVIEKIKFEILLNALGKNISRFADVDKISSNQFVALLGLIALEVGYRNASVKDSVADWKGTIIRIPKSIFPHYDPYI